MAFQQNPTPPASPPRQIKLVLRVKSLPTTSHKGESREQAQEQEVCVPGSPASSSPSSFSDSDSDSDHSPLADEAESTDLIEQYLYKPKTPIRSKPMTAAEQDAAIVQIKDSLALFREPNYSRFTNGLKAAKESYQKGLANAKRVFASRKRDQLANSGRRRSRSPERTPAAGSSNYRVRNPLRGQMRSILKRTHSFEDVREESLQRGRSRTGGKTVLFKSSGPLGCKTGDDSESSEEE